MIRILNFNDSRFAINELGDIYWYRKRYSFDAVMYIEDGEPVNRDRFYEICGELSVYPIYGLRLNVRTARSSDIRFSVTAVALSKERADVLDILSERALSGDICVDDLMAYRDQLLLGPELGGKGESLDGFIGLCRYLFTPDFVFVDEGVFDDEDFDELYDKVYDYLKGAGALVIPRLSENSKKFGRYLIENYKHDAADLDRRFLTLFTERMGH